MRGIKNNFDIKFCKKLSGNKLGRIALKVRPSLVDLIKQVHINSENAGTAVLR